MKAHKKMAFLLIFLVLYTSCSTGEIIVLRPAEPEEKLSVGSTVEEESQEIPNLSELKENEVSPEEEISSETSVREPKQEISIFSKPEELEEITAEETSAETSFEESAEIIIQEQKPDENDCVPVKSDENYIYLQSILETKTYENSMKEVILAAYEDLYQNYDKAYAYKKISKAKYLKMFCDAIKDHLEVAELVEDHDADEPYAELLESKEALGTTEGDTIYLRVDSVDRVTANMAHEVWHLENQCHKVLIADNAIDISVDVREGLSAWQERFVEPLKEEEYIVRNIDGDRTININMEIIQHNYAEYVAVYPGYKNNTARLIALLGMENYIEIVHSEHDYIISMREKLCDEFEQEKVDEFLINYVISTIFFDKNNIVVMDRLQDRYDSVRLNITENEDLLKCTSEEDFLAMWEEKIKSEEEKISSCQDILEEYKNLDMSTEYITSTIKTLENVIYVYGNTIHGRKDLLENYSYESMREIIEFDIKADQAKLKAFEDCMQDEEETIWKAVIALENSFNTLMVDRINHTRNPEEFNELTENCDNYNRCVRIRCYEGGEDVTADNFEKTVGRAIKNRPAFQPTDAR